MHDKLPVKTIKLSGRKIIGIPILIGALILLSVLFFYLSFRFRPGYGYVLFQLLAIISLLFALMDLIGFIRFAREKFIGMFISRDGIHDISTGHRYGMVFWKDVYKIKIMANVEYSNSYYIVLKVLNPEEYIERETMPDKKRSMTLKLHYYGSPICFSNRALNCSFEELENTVKQYYADYSYRKQEWEKQNVNKKNQT